MRIRSSPTLPVAHGRSRWVILLCLSLVTFLLLLDDTAVAVALPTMQEELGLEFGVLQWVVNGYTLTVAAFTLLAGRLADRNGTRRIFLIGLAVFIGGSLVIGLAPAAPVLIAFRSVQGLGAALVAPAALALIAIIFPREQRGAALGVWAGVSASALGLGPLVGALITDTLGWPWIFFLNVPLGAAAWLSARLLIPRSAAPEKKFGWDIVGVALSSVGLLSLLLMLDQANTAGWTSALVIGLALLGVTALGMFVAHERRVPEPLVDLALFKNRLFAGANIVTLLSTAVMCSLFFFLALYLQTVLGYSPLASGVILLPLTGTIVVVTPLAGRLADRFGPRLLIAGGMALLAIALWGLSWLGLDANLLALELWLALAGLGIALARTPATTLALGAANRSGFGVAAGVLNTFQASGLALGVAVMGAILTSFGPNAAFDRTGLEHHALFVQGFSTALAVNAGIAAFAAIFAGVVLRRDACGRKLGRRRSLPAIMSDRSKDFDPMSASEPTIALQ